MAEYDAIVYDLDGTLVRLDVDWDAVRDRCTGILAARGVEPGEGGVWDLRETAVEHGAGDRVDEVIAEFERDGARSADLLPLADALPHDVPVGVCSLNDEAACRIALELAGLDPHVDVVVGRGTVDVVKPDPVALLHAAERLGAAPDRVLFVGDSQSDAVTAERAGTDFAWASDRAP